MPPTKIHRVRVLAIPSKTHCRHSSWTFYPASARTEPSMTPEQTFPVPHPMTQTHVPPAPSDKMPPTVMLRCSTWFTMIGHSNRTERKRLPHRETTLAPTMHRRTILLPRRRRSSCPGPPSSAKRTVPDALWRSSDHVNLRVARSGPSTENIAGPPMEVDGPAVCMLNR